MQSYSCIYHSSAKPPPKPQTIENHTPLCPEEQKHLSASLNFKTPPSRLPRRPPGRQNIEVQDTNRGRCCYPIDTGISQRRRKKDSLDTLIKY